MSILQHSYFNTAYEHIGSSKKFEHSAKACTQHIESIVQYKAYYRFNPARLNTTPDLIVAGRAGDTAGDKGPRQGRAGAAAPSPQGGDARRRRPHLRWRSAPAARDGAADPKSGQVAMDLYTNLCFPMHAVQIKIHNNKYADLRTLTVDPPEGGPLRPRRKVSSPEMLLLCGCCTNPRRRGLPPHCRSRSG